MIYDIYDQIAYLTTVMTLEPGDILATSTPSGVAIVTGNFLKVGDVVRVEVNGLGHIVNTAVRSAADREAPLAMGRLFELVDHPDDMRAGTLRVMVAERTVAVDHDIMTGGYAAVADLLDTIRAA